MSDKHSYAVKGSGLALSEMTLPASFFAAKFADGAEIEGIQCYQHPWASNWPV
jgi:hypothetical protein